MVDGAEDDYEDGDMEGMINGRVIDLTGDRDHHEVIGAEVMLRATRADGEHLYRTGVIDSELRFRLEAANGPFQAAKMLFDNPSLTPIELDLVDGELPSTIEI